MAVAVVEANNDRKYIRTNGDDDHESRKHSKRKDVVMLLFLDIVVVRNDDDDDISLLTMGSHDDDDERQEASSGGSMLQRRRRPQQHSCHQGPKTFHQSSLFFSTSSCPQNPRHCASPSPGLIPAAGRSSISSNASRNKADTVAIAHGNDDSVTLQQLPLTLATSASRSLTEHQQRSSSPPFTTRLHRSRWGDDLFVNDAGFGVFFSDNSRSSCRSQPPRKPMRSSSSDRHALSLIVATTCHDST